MWQSSGGMNPGVKFHHRASPGKVIGPRDRNSRPSLTFPGVRYINDPAVEDLKKPGQNARRGAVLCIVLVLAGGAAPFLTGQGIDPFYLNLLQDGERSFLARDYARAVRDLEVAVFGLSADKSLSGKAYIYLSLACFSLRDMEKSRGFLTKAIDILGEKDIAALVLDPPVKSGLEKALEYFHLSISGEKTERDVPLLQGAGKGRPAARPFLPDDAAKLKETEARLRTEPDNISLYYELDRLYAQKKDWKAARRNLRSLLLKHPGESQALFCLGRLEFTAEEYRQALQHFRLFLKPSSGTRAPDAMGIKADIYAVLCLFQLKQKGSLSSYLKTVNQRVSNEDLQKILREEGLERGWRTMTSQMGRLP